MVQQMAQQNYAMKNGGELPMQGAPGGDSTPVAHQPMDMNFFGGNGGATGKFEMPAVATAPDLTPDSKAPDPKYGTGGVQFVNPSGTDKNDLSSLSAALNSAGVSSPSSGREFKADDTKKDGGFFGWIKGLAPKFRPGRRDGETDEEYDMRHTQNMQRLATFADAIRHMGNIVNTYKGGPLQQFNDPTDYLLAGYEKRKAERRQQDAADADAAYKQANLSLKERAAEAKNAYRQLILDQKNNDLKWRKEKDQRDFAYNASQDEIGNQIKVWDHELKEKGFNEKKRHNLIMEAIAELRANKIGSSRGRSGRGGGSSSAKYITWDAKGNPHYASNKTMYEANEAYYNGNTSGNSSTSNSKEVLNRDGSTTRITNRQSGSSVAQRAGTQRRQREEARKRASKPAGKSKNGYKNTKKLGL
jgi:hypothetical protein